MGFERHFVWRLGWRVAALLVVMAALAWSTGPGPRVATQVVLAAGLLGLLASLLATVRHTNLELSRLLDALRHGDASASFSTATLDAGFAELAQSMESLVAGLNAQMARLRAHNAHLHSLIEQVPIPLLTIADDDDRVTLLNHAARRLLDRPQGERLDDLAVYGAALVAGLRQRATTQQLDLRPIDDAAMRLRVTQAEVSHQGQRQRLVALQSVQPDLDAAELALARNLVRVLSHEVMNSLTPVTSLARSAAELSSGLPASPAAASVQSSIEAVARRAAGLMQFVERYRQMARAPRVERQAVEVAPMLQDLATLFAAEWAAQGVGLTIAVDDPGLVLQADRHLLEQVLLNLLRNAAQASAGRPTVAQVRVQARRAHSGGRVLIDVEDNGPGIPPALRDEVFLPFFTTRADGHGVGLSLARQIVLAHGGSIRVEDSALGGACIRLVL
jgi:two-component system, NtrC family, nitrogen regulation sensor histidine kinase NtrY